ncbi:hypothetical protein L6V77_34870, partial [Myxococcota bacterium]|nr:hypothetical protein [Myxococcota bacterium]
QPVTYEGCRDAYGRPVASVMSPGIPDIAMATIANGAPVILYNPTILSWVSPATRVFFYGHECAHHALGQVNGTPSDISKEQAADCWSVRTLMSAGILNPFALQSIQADLARLAPGDWQHLPGVQRAINLNACLGTGAPQQCRTVNIPCQHVMPCQHLMMTPYGPQPMHQADTMHPADTVQQCQ